MLQTCHGIFNVKNISRYATEANKKQNKNAQLTESIVSPSKHRKLSLATNLYQDDEAQSRTKMPALWVGGKGKGHPKEGGPTQVMTT